MIFDIISTAAAALYRGNYSSVILSFCEDDDDDDAARYTNQFDPWPAKESFSLANLTLIFTYTPRSVVIKINILNKIFPRLPKSVTFYQYIQSIAQNCFYP